MTVDRDQVVTLTRAGYSRAEIAEIVGCSPTHVGRLRAAAGVSRPADTSPISAERLAAIAAMVADGASRSEISRTLRTHRRTVARYFPESGWSAQESGRFTAVLRKWGRP